MDEPHNRPHFLTNVLTILAAGGILVAVMLALIFVFYPWFVHHQVLSMNSRVQNDMRTVFMALQSYAVDHGAYPPPDVGPDGWLVVPVGLTTPVAYLYQLVDDYYATGLRIPHGYRVLDPEDERWAQARDFKGDMPRFILLSWGPSKDGSFRQRDELLLYDPSNGAMSPGYLHRFGGYPRLDPALYDPTNGTIANGIQ